MGDLLRRNLQWVACIVLAAASLGCATTMTVPKPLPQPFATLINDDIVHDYYRGVTLEQFTASPLGRSLDSIDFDLTIPKYFIVLVTVKTASHDAPLDLITTFSNGYRQTIVKTWKVVPDNQRDTAHGLFFVPEDFVAASTTMTSGGTNLENAQPLSAAGT